MKERDKRFKRKQQIFKIEMIQGMENASPCKRKPKQGN